MKSEKEIIKRLNDFKRLDKATQKELQASCTYQDQCEIITRSMRLKAIIDNLEWVIGV